MTLVSESIVAPSSTAALHKMFTSVHSPSRRGRRSSHDIVQSLLQTEPVLQYRPYILTSIQLVQQFHDGLEGIIFGIVVEARHQYSIGGVGKEGQGVVVHQYHAAFVAPGIATGGSIGRSGRGIVLVTADQLLPHPQHVAQVLGVHPHVRIIDAVLAVEAAFEHFSVRIETVEDRSGVDLQVLTYMSRIDLASDSLCDARLIM